MKRLIFSAFCAAVFFIGVGAIATSVSARFASDEKALEIVNRARIAIGGEAAIADIRNLVIKGSSTINIEMPDGSVRAERGESQMALELPDMFIKTMSLSGGADGEARKTVMAKTIDKVVIGKNELPTETMTGAEKGELSGDAFFTTDNGRTVVLRRVERKPTETGQVFEAEVAPSRAGDPARTGTVIVDKIKGGEAHPPQNEMLRLMLGLLLTPPKGVDVVFTYVGEETVDSVPVNVVSAQTGGSSIKLYFSKLSSLPVMVRYMDEDLPRTLALMIEAEPAGAEAYDDKEIRVIRRAPDIEISGHEPEPVETTLKFSDPRFTNGLQLPFKWTTLRNGKIQSVFEVNSYEKNVGNIADQFPGTKLRIRRADKQ